MKRASRPASLRAGGRDALWLALGGTLLVPPLQEFAEQRLALLVRHGGGGATLALEEARELGRCDLRIAALRAHALQHFLRYARSGPARNGGGQVHVTPFRMPRRLEKLLPFGEQALGEFLH